MLIIVEYHFKHSCLILKKILLLMGAEILKCHFVSTEFRCCICFQQVCVALLEIGGIFDGEHKVQIFNYYSSSKYHKVSFAHNVSFWPRKLTHNASFWGQ